ncbi:hypothetical protein [Nocardia jiangxiensis]|uniref:Uncharacterized protein n=1 Tax=Nocardia jiangxiensis TaxID=282685 RepID=A0ABW6RX74_9NOCA|nr:hypothetical protein [Nocardia jiangxiensis]
MIETIEILRVGMPYHAGRRSPITGRADKNAAAAPTSVMEALLGR